MSFEAMAWAIRQKLPTKEKFTLLMLANYASNEKGDCYPSINTLAESTSMSRDSIMRALKSLEESGHIQIKKRMQDGVNLPNFYTLTFINLQGVVAVSDYGSSCERLRVVAVSDSNLSDKPINKPSNGFDPLVMPLPQNVSLEKWKEWIAYRKDQKFKSAQATLKKQLEFLEGQGNDAGLIIDETIRNGWQGLFPLKNRPSAPPEPIKASVEIKWHETAEGFKAKGAELGVIQIRGELFADFQQRVIDAFKQQRGNHAA